jgi:c-di-GMP-binding flagellar brake protein YcgR
MREMRKSGRVYTRCHVVTKVLKHDDPAHRYGPPRYGLTSDFSAGGMRLVLGEDLPPDATVELVIVLENPPAIFQHFGRIRWCKPSADQQKRFVGVEFTATSPAVMEAWLRMLADRYPNTISKRSPQFAKDADSIW